MERLAWLLIIAFGLWLRSFQLGDQILIVRHFINLARPLDELRKRGDFVVFHRRLDLGNLTEPWVTYDGRGLPPVDGRIEAFRKALGAPIFTDETITVFALRLRPLP